MAEPPGDADALHPAVLERYGEQACRAWLGEVVQAARTVRVIDILDFRIWTYTTDGRSADIEHTYAFSAEVTLVDGSMSTIEAHAALRDDASIGWFTDCGEPLE